MVPNLRIALYYVTGATILILAIFSLGVWGLPLAWPALAMLLVAAGYTTLGPAIYGKRGGRLSPLSRLLLAPTQFCQYLSLLYYRRQCRPWDEVAPGVFIGSMLTRKEATRLTEAGLKAVLDLTAEFSETPDLQVLRYHNIPILDLTALTPAHLTEAVQFIQACRQRGDGVFVHCKAGYSRSANVVGAYLMAAGICRTTGEAIARLRQVRPSIVIRPEVRNSLRQFEQMLQASCWSKEGER